jgi:hypothetical protein
VRVLMLIACVGVAFAQSDQDADANMSCVERLEMPVYPPLARQARIGGTITATVAVDATGSIQATLSRGAHQLLSPAVEKSLRASKFRKACSGKSVTLVFNFVAGDDFDPDGLRQRVSFGYPNQFSIWAPAFFVQP